MYFIHNVAVLTVTTHGGKDTHKIKLFVVCPLIKYPVNSNTNYIRTAKKYIDVSNDSWGI